MLCLLTNGSSFEALVHMLQTSMQSIRMQSADNLNNPRDEDHVVSAHQGSKATCITQELWPSPQATRPFSAKP